MYDVVDVASLRVTGRLCYTNSHEVIQLQVWKRNPRTMTEYRTFQYPDPKPWSPRFCVQSLPVSPVNCPAHIGA